jgi:hypothetical protein
MMTDTMNIPVVVTKNDIPGVIVFKGLKVTAVECEPLTEEGVG